MKKTYIAPETFVFTTLNTSIMISSIGINSSADPGDSQLVKGRNDWDIWSSNDGISEN